MVGDNLLDLTEDTLLQIVKHILVNKTALLALQNSCSFFETFFTTYSIWRKHKQAVEDTWMIPKPINSTEVVIASNDSEKEEQLNNSEHMEVLFMDICDKYIVLVRYNQLDIVCSCLSMECQCRVDEKDSFEQMNAVPKRLEIWDHKFRIVRVISSKNFGLNSSKTLGGAEEFTFWSSMKREYPLFSYNKERKIFAWVGSQIQDIQVDFHFIEENKSLCTKIGSSTECYRAYAVSMFRDTFAIAFEKKFTPIRFQLLIRWYQYDALDQFEEILVSDSETNIGKYCFSNCSPIDINETYTVIVNEVQFWGVEEVASFRMSVVNTERMIRTRNIQFYSNQSRIFMKMNEKTNLIAMLDSSEDFGEHSLVKLYKAENLEEVLSLNLRSHSLDKTTLLESSNRVFWFGDILAVVSDEDIADETDFVSGRKLTFFTITHKGDHVVSKRRDVDFWPGFVSKQTSTDPKLPLLGSGKDKGLFLEAVAAGEMGIAVAARLNCDYNEDIEDNDEMSYLFYMSMLPL